MDLTILFDIDEVQSVSEELAMLTNMSSAIVPNDLNTAITVVETIVRLVWIVKLLSIYIETHSSWSCNLRKQMQAMWSCEKRKMSGFWLIHNFTWVKILIKLNPLTAKFFEAPINF